MIIGVSGGTALRTKVDVCFQHVMNGELLKFRTMSEQRFFFYSITFRRWIKSNFFLWVYVKEHLYCRSARLEEEDYCYYRVCYSRHHQSVLPKVKSFIANAETKVAVLSKGRSSTANTGTSTIRDKLVR